MHTAEGSLVNPSRPKNPLLVFAIALVTALATFTSAGLAAAVEDPVLVVDDMENGVPNGVDGDGVAVGWNTFQDAASTVAVTTTDTPPAPRPDAAAGNSVLQLDADVEAFAGVTHSFSNEAVDAWVPQDWSTYAGFAVWVYGQNTGTGMFIDVLDNRNPGSTTDDAERWTVSFTDDFSGWQLLEWQWTEFARKGIGNGAPDDGLNLTEVHGWALGAVTTSGPVTWYADDAQVFGTRPLALSFDRPIFDVDEGAGTAEVTVDLTRAAEEDIDISVATSASTDRTSSEDLIATPDRDYTPTSADLTIPAGATSVSWSVPLIDDAKDEVAETFLVEITDFPAGFDPGPAGRASVSIMDNDPSDPNLVEDFEGEHDPAMLDVEGAATVAVREIEQSDPDAIPGQGLWERVADVTGPGSAGHDFPMAQDFSAGDGLGLWVYGTGDGSELTLTLKDNRAPDPGPDGWVPTWADEFDGPAGAPADPASWTYETGGWGWGNQELQYYTDSTDNAAMDGAGNLVITAREVPDPEAAGLPCWYGDCTHTSARLITEGKQEFGYGRWEARVKVAEGTGIWPAFWSLGNDFRAVGWPQTGEIDVMEFVGRQPTSIFGTIHGPGYAGGESYGSGPIDLGEPVGNAYHDFAVEWQPGLITWELDGVQYHTATPADLAPREWVFDHPFTLLLNVALGGNFGGPLGPDLDLPQETLVDWVRVWSAADTAERFEATIVDDTAGWREVVVPWTDFTRAADQPAGAPDDGLTLTEAWGWELAQADAVTRSIDQLRLVEAPCLPEAVVTTAADSGPGSLRRVLDQACDGATITFDPSLADAEIVLASQLTLEQDVTIDATDAPGVAVSGNAVTRVIEVAGGVEAVVEGLAVVDGAAQGRGAGILNYGDLTFTDGRVAGNRETSAGPPAFDQGGAGIWTGENASLTLVRSTVADNATANQPGGGVYGFFGSTLTIMDSTISGNVGGDVAGGIRSLGTTVVMDSTISGNTSTNWHGGGIFATDGTVSLTNVTVADNTSPAGTAGGLLVATFGANASATLTNTIVAGNTGGGSLDCFLGYFGGGAIAITSADGNLDSDGSCAFTQPSDQSGVDPQLGPLADNGGPTLTHLPDDFSPVVDAGVASCDDADQRGVARDESCDIGAVEVVVDETRDTDGDGVEDVLEVAAGSDRLDAESLPECDGQVFTILGSLDDDVLVGTDGDDVILSLDGNDEVHGGNGNDVICGGDDNDTLSGDNGKDVVFGEAGDDDLSGNNGKDVLVGGDDVDAVDGGNGKDQCDGEVATRCEMDVADPPA